MRYESCMTAIESVRNLPLHEKLQVLEAIWDDLTGEASPLEIPDWHRDILDERAAMVLDGKAKFLDWDVVKQRLIEATA